MHSYQGYERSLNFAAADDLFAGPADVPNRRAGDVRLIPRIVVTIINSEILEPGLSQDPSQ